MGTYYTIWVTWEGQEWTVQRRYRDFHCLNKRLVYLSCELPDWRELSQNRGRMTLNKVFNLRSLNNRRLIALKRYLKNLCCFQNEIGHAFQYVVAFFGADVHVNDT